MHTPWFKSNLLNSLYSALNSINIGFPQIYYHHEHLQHHRYVNDRQDEQGLTQDPTSTFAFGENDDHEKLLPYCFLGLFRADLVHSYQDIQKKGGGIRLWTETGFILAGWAIMMLLSWQYFLLVYLPTFYFGWCLEHLENYYEHFGGVPEDRYANSTSYYGRLYNWLFCNEGYHQEHHLRPNVHWRYRPQTRRDFQFGLDQADRIILRLPPTLAWIEHDRLAEQARQRVPRDPDVPDMPDVIVSDLAA